MNALELPAEPTKSRVPTVWFHPAELGVLVAIAALVHFAARQPWGAAFSTGLLLFYFLPRGEIYPSSSSGPQWTWLVLRWVTLGEVTLLFLATLGLYSDGDSWLVVSSRTLAALFLARLFAALVDVGEKRFPLDARATIIINWICGLVFLALIAPRLWHADWHAIAQWRPNFEATRPDWTSAIPILIAVIVFVLFVGPPLELWNRAVKPLEARRDLTDWQCFGIGMAAVAACILWWALLVLLLFWIGSQPNFMG